MTANDVRIDARDWSPREIMGALVIGSALLLIDGRVLERFRRPAVIG